MKRHKRTVEELLSIDMIKDSYTVIDVVQLAVLSAIWLLKWSIIALIFWIVIFLF